MALTYVKAEIQKAMSTKKILIQKRQDQLEVKAMAEKRRRPDGL